MRLLGLDIWINRLVRWTIDFVSPPVVARDGDVESPVESVEPDLEVEEENEGALEEIRISDYDDLVKRFASEYGLDWMLISSQIYAESNFDPNAVSVAGAMGLMQIMPSTARWLGLEDLDKLYDPEVNIELGVRFDSWLWDLVGEGESSEDRIRLMLASYNAGPSRVRGLRRIYGSTYFDIEPSLPVETQRYVSKILSKWNDYKLMLGETKEPR